MNVLVDNFRPKTTYIGIIWQRERGDGFDTVHLYQLALDRVRWEMKCLV